MLRNSTTSDSRLIRQVLAGRRQAFDILVERYLHVVHAVAYAQVGNHADADDVAQETFIKAFLSLDTLREPARFPAWLATIARRLCYRILTKTRRREEPLPCEPRLKTLAGATALPDVERREIEEIVRQHIDALQPEYREALMLRYYARRSVKEVARIQEISPATAAKRLQRAREALGERLMNVLGDSQERGGDKVRAQVLGITGAVAAVQASWETTVSAGAASTGATFLQGLAQALSLKLAIVTFSIVLVVSGSCLAALRPHEEQEGLAASPQTLQQAKVDDRFPRPEAEHEEHDAPAVEPVLQDHETAAPETPPVERAVVAPCVTGRVYDSDTDAGVADVRVRVHPLTADLPRGEAQSDASGNYCIEGLAAGEYDVKVSEIEGYHWQRLEVPDRRVYVRADAPTIDVDFTVSKGITVRGKIVNESGDPIADAEVGGRAEGSGLSRSYDARSGQDGAFEIFGFEETNRFCLAARKKGYAVAPQGPFNLPIEGLHDVMLTMGPESSIEGVLVDGEGNPLEEVRISLWPEPSYWSTLAGFDTEPTDSQGRFRVAGLWPAAYRVSVGFPGDDSYRRLENLTPIEVGIGEALTGLVLVYEAENAYTISGHVKDHRGQPVKRATVVATGASWSQASTDEFGFYCLSEIKEGDNDLLVWHRKYCTARVSDVQEGSDGVDFILQPRGAVEGRVVNAHTGEPIADFEVLEHSRKDWWQGRAEYVRVQHAEGRFVLTGVETGERCTVVARAQGYAPASSEAFSVTSGETTRGVIVKLAPGASLSGVVLNPKGEPVRNARLTIGEFPRSRMIVDEYASAVTEKDGSFRIDSLPVAEVTVHAHHPTYGPASATVQLDLESENFVELKLGQGGTLRGVVRTQEEPIVALRVQVSDVSPALYETQTDENGIYAITGLPPGDMEVVTNPTFGERGNWTGRKQIKAIEIIDGETTELDFDFDLWHTEVQGMITVDGEPPDSHFSMVHFIYDDTGDGTDMFYTSVDKTGHYHLLGARPGPAIMRFGRAERVVEIREGQVSELDFDVERTE